MAKKKYKLGWGEEGKILSAINSGLLDGGDLVVTKDTKRLAFIDPTDEVVHFINSRLITFDSLDGAAKYASSSKSAYAGELISVLVSGKYKTYRLQSAQSGYILEDIESSTTGIKQYVQVVDEFPTSSQEEGIIYISGSTGKIWTGSEWRIVFENIASIKEEIDKKAPLENPEFTGIVQINGEEVALKSYVEQLIATLPSIAPGVVDGNNALPTVDYKAGQTWRVAENGTYAGQVCESGDLIICVNDFSVTYSDDDFIIVQGNINGAVTGANSSTDNELVIFSGISGKVIKNSGINLSVLEDVIAKAHEHVNKEVLDTFTMTQEELLQASEDTISGAYDDIMNRIYHKEPFVEGNYLYANGHGLTIEAVDDATNKAIYYLSGQKKELTFGVDGVIIGGAKNDNCYSSSIIMNSGNVGIIHGGSFGNGDVAHANIVINGGTLEAIYGGGHPETKVSDRANHTGTARIIINNVSGTPQIFGGGFSYATTGSAKIMINKGNFTYVTGGGSNGYTSEGIIEINGGNVRCVQSVNRGILGRAKITVNSGDVIALYTGVEPGEGATGAFGHTELHLLGGSIHKLAKGLNDNKEDYIVADYVSGDYRKSVVVEEEATAMGLTVVTDVIHEDVETAKTEAITEAKNYVDSAITLVEF